MRDIKDRQTEIEQDKTLSKRSGKKGNKKRRKRRYFSLLRIFLISSLLLKLFFFMLFVSLRLALLFLRGRAERKFRRALNWEKPYRMPSLKFTISSVFRRGRNT